MGFIKGVRVYATILLFIIFLMPVSVRSDDLFNCTIRANCNANETEMLGMNNDTGGYNNAHAQLGNYSANEYPYHLCCWTQSWRNLVNNNDTAFLRLFNITNSHVQIPSVNTYSYPQKIGVDIGNFSCTYPDTSCSAGYVCMLSIASSEGDNSTNSHVAECNHYTKKVCCKMQHAPPNMPELIWPGNNTNITDRTPNLNWSSTIDPDGDSITYNLNLSASAGCTVEHYETGISDSNFTTNQLCTDSVYYWKVRACDTDGCSAWTEPWQFIVESQLGITFLVNNSDFGIMALGEENDTTDDSPPPMTLENTGNINVDVDVKANNTLFSHAALNTSNFQYEVSVNESGSYNESASQGTFAYFTGNFTSAFINLSYVNASDSGNIEIKVIVPSDEPTGNLFSTIIARAVAS